MVAAARSRGLFLMEALWSRFLPAYAVSATCWPPGASATRSWSRPTSASAATFDPAHRLFDRALGGGALLDLGIYPVQLASLVLGPPDRVVAQAHLGVTGRRRADRRRPPPPRRRARRVKAAITTGLSCTGRVSGTDGWIDLPAFMHCPDHLVVGGAGGPSGSTPPGRRGPQPRGRRGPTVPPGGQTESPLMPLDESLALAGTLDAIRSQIGLTYPGE